VSGRENEKIVKTDGILEYLNDNFSILSLGLETTL